MQYPAIVYERDTAQAIYAGNRPYTVRKRYQVTVIDEDPDSDIPENVAMLPLTSHLRFFVADNLNHDVFLMYF
jgi:hypothetical protein